MTLRVFVTAGIESLKRVEHLDVSGNHLTIIPEDIQKMVSLKTFKAGRNEIEFIPPLLGQCKRVCAVGIVLSITNRKVTILIAF